MQGSLAFVVRCVSLGIATQQQLHDIDEAISRCRNEWCLAGFVASFDDDVARQQQFNKLEVADLR